MLLILIGMVAAMVGGAMLPLMVVGGILFGDMTQAFVTNDQEASEEQVNMVCMSNPECCNANATEIDFDACDIEVPTLQDFLDDIKRFCK